MCHFRISGAKCNSPASGLSLPIFRAFFFQASAGFLAPDIRTFFSPASAISGVPGAGVYDRPAPSHGSPDAGAAG